MITPGIHTVEKIGGTSMSRFGEVMRNVILPQRLKGNIYNRVFVVSAYGGITNMLLEDKKNGAPGVYAHFAAGNPEWVNRLDDVRARMKALNRSFEELGLPIDEADAFVDRRLDGIRSCLEDLMRVRSYGHLAPRDYLPASREMLSAVGEAHSAHNSTLILQKQDVQAVFCDLTRWRETELLPLNDVIRIAFARIDLAKELPMVTGYVKCDEGIMTHFERGYSEITFSRIAAITHAREGIIHKEYHLSTGDPVLVGPQRVQVIGNTNFDVADQMSDMNMEAIHSKASKEMELKNIPIRIKNAFDPEHPGTLISREYVSHQPRVEMICGRDDIVALLVHDPDMVGKVGYDHRLLGALVDNGISYVAKNTDANTITHYFGEKAKRLEACVRQLKEMFPEAEVSTHKVAIVSIMGSNMRQSQFLARATRALVDEDIVILGVNQSFQPVNIQFILSRAQYEKAQLALHREFIETAQPEEH